MLNVTLLCGLSPPSPIQRLLSEVEVSVSVEDQAASRYWVSVSPLCPDGSTAKDQGCSGVKPSQKVKDNSSIPSVTNRMIHTGI